MKLVSAAKYARANQAVLKARPYGDTFDKMVQKLAASCESDAPLLQKRENKKSLVIIISSDRGLCGGLNSNLFKKTNREIQKLQDDGIEVDLVVWGRRAVMYGQKSPIKKLQSVEKVLDKPSFDFASQAAKDFSNAFISEEYDRVFVIYSKFINAMTQEPTIGQLLPVFVPEQEESASDDYIFEPEKAALLNSLLSKQLASKIHRLFLEGAASEHAARMTAMDSATSNADEVIKRLTLQYNRARQAAITTELIEITSGAEAL